MRTIMLEPIGGFCNLSCDYCYQEAIKESFKVMSLEILEKIIIEALNLDNNDKINFLYHGGEPTLAGLSFFKKIIHIQKRVNKRGIKIKNLIQTNATCINKKWARFFSENNFSVGTSLDGTKWLHDKTRDSSYDQTLKGIMHLKNAGCKIGILTTVSTKNVLCPEEIWFKIIKPKQLAKSFELNVCSLTESSYLRPSEDDVLNFYIKLFNLWIENDDPEIYIKTFRIVLRSMFGGNTRDCAFEYGKCNKFAAIDEKGDVYVCNRFLKRPVAYLGNIMKDNLINIINSEKAIYVYDQISRIKDECKNCEWLICCGGGCAFQRWIDTGEFNAGFPDCEFRKKFFSHIKNYLISRGITPILKNPT